MRHNGHCGAFGKRMPRFGQNEALGSIRPRWGPNPLLNGPHSNTLAKVPPEHSSLSEMGFKYVLSGAVALWTGDPGSQAGHDYLRTWLKNNIKPYPVVWKVGDTRTQGNLGEVIAYCVGELTALPTFRCFAANAFYPFSGIARNTIDLVWIQFGPNPADDYAIIQEVKTTFDFDLTYAKALITDYEKSFGINPRFTLSTHFNEIKLKLEKEHKRPDLAARMNNLIATGPGDAKKVRCIPTLVHDDAGIDAAGTLTAVQCALKAQGWAVVNPCSIALSDIAARFPRIVEDRA
jgi:hypothetical protein